MAFKAIAVSTDQIDWGDSDEIPKTINLAGALRTAESMVETWLEEVKAKKVVVCWSCRDRDLFRRHIFPAYKGERTEKPDEYWRVVEHLEGIYPSVELPYLEADDVMGILTGEKQFDNIIVSSDKDMKTIPGRLYNPHARTKKVITKASADNFWMTQTLMGDATDGYKGCPKIGAKTAEKILAQCSSLDSMWLSVVETYRAKELDTEYALTQARLARILRPEDYDMDTQEIKLWHPRKDRVAVFKKGSK